MTQTEQMEQMEQMEQFDYGRTERGFVVYNARAPWGFLVSGIKHELSARIIVKLANIAYGIAGRLDGHYDRSRR